MAAPAQAIDIQNFYTAIGSNNLFTNYTSDPLEPWQFVIGASTNISSEPLIFMLPGEQELRVVEQVVGNQFYAAFGIAGYVDIGVAGSYDLVSGADLDRGDEVDDIFPGNNNLSAAVGGDTRVMIKGRILENKPGWVGLALVPIVHFPTGYPVYYNGAGAIDFGGLLVLDKRFDRVNIVLNGGYKYKGVSESPGVSEADIIPANEFLFSLGMKLYAHRTVDVIAEFNGKTVDYGLENIDPEVPIELALGARFYSGYGVSFIAGGGAGVTSGIGSPAFRGFFGVEVTYPKIDRKPPMKGGRPAVDANSKTDDSDRDGLTNWEESNKYGTDFMNSDSDGDGLKDGDEVKIYRTNPKAVDTDEDDLTDGEEVKLYKSNPLKTDTDGDTLADGIEVNDLRTNPTKYDTDGDKIGDHLDGAPLAAETVNGFQDKDGVPEVTLAKRPSGVILFEDVIWMPTGIVWSGTRKDQIAPESIPMLDDIAIVMGEYTAVKIQIECHVARGGSESANKMKTKKQAEAIRNYLIKKGVAPGRLAAIGSGSDYPLASNSTPKGRAKNTRTEFLIFEK
jgi:outer membrane protein OmpA-like peptidoglycan-associated protein